MTAPLWGESLPSGLPRGSVSIDARCEPGEGDKLAESVPLTRVPRAARCVGGSGLRIAFVHVMPNALTPALANLSPTIGFSILLASALSFVGAGVPIPTPEWGSMIAIGAPNMMTGQWWTALFPGLALGLTILGYALVGDGFRYYLDPVNRR